MKDRPVILVVDDLSQNIELLEAHLEPQGYNILKATSGEETFEKLSGNQIDLVLLDIMMPGMDGFEVLEKLRADKKTARIPVIMITVLKEAEDRVKAVEAGCDDFITKPFDKHELLVRVKSLLRIKFLNDEVDEAREYADSIINTVREPLIVLDQDLRVVSASRSFYDVFRVNPNETVGQLIYDLGNKQWDIPRLRELLETILPQKTTFDNYEVEHDFAAIGRRIMLLNARQINRAWGKNMIILLAIEDITERKRLEDLLSKSEERYRRLFETASDGIVLLEKSKGHITHANPSAENMLEYSVEECKGKNLQDIGVPIDMADFPTIMQALNKNGIIHYDDVRIKTKSGKSIYTDIYMVDRAALAQCNIRDITEHKKLEDQLRHSQKMEAVGTLAGGIAHDFNNILNVIMGYGSMILDKLEANSRLKEQMNAVLTAAERAATLTKRLLDFSRKQVVEVKPGNVNEIVIGLQKMLCRMIRENIDFTLNIANGPLTVLADAGQLEQVLMNLVTNARDAMPDGGRLTISTGFVELDDAYVAAYGYGKPGKYALITVSDSGQGMDGEIQKKIFEPFFTSKGIGEGTGLGLAISYGIIKQHNGYIKVYSEPGQGTEFKIYLPLVEESADFDKKTEDLVSVKGGTETILVAEDDAALRQLTENILESYGYAVITAEDGEDAIRKFMENRDKIQLVILDMIMPKKNGKEAYEEIRKTSPGIKSLFTSGYTMDSIKTGELTEVGLDFVHKPIRPQDLLRKVREILDR